MRTRSLTLAALLSFVAAFLNAQDRAALPIVNDVEPQPLVAQVRRLVEALDFLGVPLRAADRTALDAALQETDAAKSIEACD